MMKKLSSYIQKFEQPRILDIATGAGNFISLLTTLTNEVDEIIGIDKEKSAIDLARKNFNDDRIHFQQMHAHHLEFAPHSFDIVTFSNSLHHVNDIEGLFEQVNRVLKDDGLFIIAEMVSDKLSDTQKSHRQLHHFAAKIDRLCGIIHNQTLTRKEIKDKVSNISHFTVLDDWILRFNRKKSNSDEEIDWLLKTIDKLLEKIPHNNTEIDSLIKEGNRIKSYIKTNGFDSCPTKVMVLKR